MDLQFQNSELTALILECAFDVIQELGAGFLESVYKNAFCIALEEKGLSVEVEKSFTVYFRGEKVGLYKADLIVEGSVIIELKCCQCLLPEHQAQVINYLKATDISIGLLINFGNKKLGYKRLIHPDRYRSSRNGDTYVSKMQLTFLYHAYHAAAGDHAHHVI